MSTISSLGASRRSLYSNSSNNSRGSGASAGGRSRTAGSQTGSASSGASSGLVTASGATQRFWNEFVTNSTSHSSKKSKLQSILRCRTLTESLHTVYGKEGEEDAPRKGSMAHTVTTSSSSSASTASHLRRRQQRRVHHHVGFGSVEVREYARTIGDNPSCSSGPPVSLDWHYDPNAAQYDIVDFEAMKHKARRTEKEMAIPRTLREDMLFLEWNVSPDEMAAAVREVIRVKNQRRHTIHYCKNKGWGRVDGALKRSRSAILTALGLRMTESQTTQQALTLDKQHRTVALLEQLANEHQEQQQNQDDATTDIGTTKLPVPPLPECAPSRPLQTQPANMAHDQVSKQKLQQQQHQRTVIRQQSTMSGHSNGSKSQSSNGSSAATPPHVPLPLTSEIEEYHEQDEDDEDDDDDDDDDRSEYYFNPNGLRIDRLEGDTLCGMEDDDDDYEDESFYKLHRDQDNDIEDDQTDFGDDISAITSSTGLSFRFL